MLTDIKYWKVRQMCVKTLLAQEQAGLKVNPLTDIEPLMTEIKEKGLINQMYNKIVRWEAIGCINNLFKIGATPCKH